MNSSNPEAKRGLEEMRDLYAYWERVPGRARAVGKGDGAMSAAIETEKLTKTYGRSRGIRYVDLAVEEGEVFGFLGPNGAGKTTTVRTLLGFLRPTGGQAWVFGMETRKKAWRSGPGSATCPGSSRWRIG
jgi:ABC-type glutathione transport system ATPase component